MKPVTFSTIWSTRAFACNFSELHVWLVVDSTKCVGWRALEFTEFSIVDLKSKLLNIFVEYLILLSKCSETAL